MDNKPSKVRDYLSKFWDPTFLFSNAVIPLIVLSLYFLALSYFLPDGVNKLFTQKSWRYPLATAAFAGVASLWLAKNGRRSPNQANTVEKISLADLALLLLPLMPVAQYIISNQDILPPAHMVYVIAFFAALSFMLVILVPKLLSGIASTQTMMLLGTAFAFTITNMASLSNYFSWFDAGSLRFQWPILGGVFISSWFLYDLKQKRLLQLLITALFVTNTAVQVSTPRENVADPVISFSEADNDLFDLIGERTPVSLPGIYLLVYDSYVPNETMLSHGIDNSAQEDLLRDLRFTFYPHTYSVAGLSVSTMSRVLNAANDYYGPSRRAVSGDGIVHNLLKSFGYKTYGIFASDHFFRGAQSRYDFSFPNNATSATLVSEAILSGAFRFDAGSDEVPYENFLATKRDVFVGSSEAPVFLYAHSKYPNHSQLTRECRPNEIELYAERLALANVEMREDLEFLVANDPEAIIIIAGDHGPYLTKNCNATNKEGYSILEITRQDIQDRFGTFLAIRWPSSDFENYDDITVLQDVFPAIFAFLFQDAALLEGKIEPETVQPERISGASVQNGIIHGGVDDGEPLFLK